MEDPSRIYTVNPCVCVCVYPRARCNISCLFLRQIRDHWREAVTGVQRPQVLFSVLLSILNASEKSTLENLTLPSLIFNSHISVIPPTPPPHMDQQFLSRLGVRHAHVSSVTDDMGVLNVQPEGQMNVLLRRILKTRSLSPSLLRI